MSKVTFMDWQEYLDRFEFKNYFPRHDQVHSVPTVEMNSFRKNRQIGLSIEE